MGKNRSPVFLEGLISVPELCSELLDLGRAAFDDLEIK